MATWSGRGQGACPNCSATYSSRWKPSNCSKCGFELGGSAPVSKAQKMCCPPAVNICGGLHSIRTSSRDDCCLVYSKNNLWICLHADCKDVQAAYVSSDHAVDFTCQHIKQVSDSIGVLDKYNLIAAKIAAYPCDTLTKALLDNISIPLDRKPSTKSPTARTLFMDPQVLPIPLVFVMSRLKMPRKWVLPFTNAVVKVLLRRQNKRSRVLFVSIFMFSFAHWNCTRMLILSPLLHLQH